MQIKDLQKKRALHSVLLILLLSAVGMTNALAQISITVGDLYYSINEDETTVTLVGHVDGTNATGSLTIPSSITYYGNTYSVTKIGYHAFENCTGFTGSLTISNSVTEIGGSAFRNCTGFTGSPTIPNSVTTIGYNAFENCTGFTGNLVIPNSVTTIGGSAFYGCSGFTGSLVIPNFVTSIGASAFRDCTGFTGSLVIPNSVTAIYSSAFEGCTGFTGSLTIGNSVTLIGGSAFEGCTGFTGSLTIPNSVTSIEGSAFYGCTGFTGSLTIGNSVTTIGLGAFEGCNGFTGSLTIGNSVTSIGWRTFRGCNGFTGNLVIPNSVTGIGTQAFENCTGFTGSLTIGNSVTSIGGNAFSGCNGFSDVHFNATNCHTNDNIPAFVNCSGSFFIGDNVERISTNIFKNAGFTGNLTIPNSVTEIEGGAFYGCIGFTGNLDIPNSVTEIGGSAFSGCSGFTGSLTIGNSVTSIGSYAFSGCSGFTGNLTIPNSVTEIEGGAFYGCIGFTGNLDIPNSVTEIGGSAFSGCIGFTGSLTISNSVTEIGGSAFQGCTGFTGSLTIPNSVTTIWGSAFYGCTGFTDNLTIGNSVATIRYGAFTGCSGFTSMTVFAEEPPTTNDSFDNMNHSIPVYVPCGSKEAYEGAYDWNTFTNIRDVCDLLTYSINDDGVSVTVTGHVDGSAATGPLIIPETKTIDGVTYAVTAIGNNAFRNCYGLTGDLVIPNSVVTIGMSAFRDCSGFDGNLVLGNSVATIGNYAFACQSGGNYTGNLVIPNSVTRIGAYAFQNCNNLTGSLTLGSSINMIGGNSFNGCGSFSSIVVLMEIPQTITSNVFPSVLYSIPVTVPCGSLSLYQLFPNWNSFTNMQEDCFEMFEVMATADPMEGGRVVIGTEGETLFADSFEDYAVGNGIAYEAVASGHDWWSTWDGNPGGEKDGLVVDYDGTRCGHLTYGNDQVLLLNKDSGVYDIEFDILVPDGKNAFFSFIHQFDEAVNEAMYCRLHFAKDGYQNTLTPGHGTISAGGYALTDIPCVYDAWMHFRFHVDINANIARFYYTAPESEETFLCQWPWSWKANSASYTDTGLAAMDFWPPMDEDYSEFYIDNFSLRSFTGEQPEVHYNYAHDTYFAPGSTCAFTAIPNEGYSFVNWTKNGAVVSTQQTISFTASEDAVYVANFCNDDGNTQTTALSAGTNWFSTYLDITLDDLEAALVTAAPANSTITIKNATQSVVYSRGHWNGTLDWDVAKRYNIKVASACELTLEGMPIDPSEHPVTVVGGGMATWIGFPLGESMTLTNAFAGFAQNGDVIKSQYGNATYTRGHWNGEFSLEPGKGYLYISAPTAADRTLTFPAGTK